nr:hypothetical protein [Tanacetum cinerariifolium]
MLNNKCRTSFVKPEYLKKVKQANPRLYDIGCYNDNLALMLSLESDEVIRLEKESRSKLSDLIRPFDYAKLNSLYDLFVPIREKSYEQRFFQKDRENVKLPKNKMSVTACNDSLNARTLNVTSVFSMCDNCVMIDKHDLYVINSVAKPLKKTVALESNKKPRNNVRKLNERFGKIYKWSYIKFTPSGYMWKPKSPKGNVNPNVSLPLDNVSKTANVKDTMTSRCFIVSNTPLSSNSFATDRDCSIHRRLWCSKHMTGNLKLLINFVEKFLGTNDIVVGLPKLKFIKDHLCSSCELGKANRKSFHSKFKEAVTTSTHGLMWSHACSKLSPRRKCQENVSHGDKTGTTSNELDLLFSLMFDELLNGSSKVVSKSSA